MRITVTTKDIEAGRRRDPSECPVAQALRRAGISHFGVTGMLVIIQDGRKHIPLVLPANVQEWILDFDWGSTMSPIEFELNWPQEQEPHLESEPTAEPAPQPCPSRPRAGLSRLPHWSATAKGLLTHSLRQCQPRHKARVRTPAEKAEKELVAS
jgi:hypothetical protein